MIFNSKYSEINDLFAELGCTIGKLGDSSKYDERFISIADRVIVLNEGGKVDRKVLSADIDLMLGMLEKEGYVRSSVAIMEEACVSDRVKNQRLRYDPIQFIKDYWNMPYRHHKDQRVPIYILPIILLFLIGAWAISYYTDLEAETWQLVIFCTCIALALTATVPFAMSLGDLVRGIRQARTRRRSDRVIEKPKIRSLLAEIWSHSDGEEKGLILSILVFMVLPIALISTIIMGSSSWIGALSLAIWLTNIVVMICFGFIGGNFSYLYQTIQKVKQCQHAK